jgi:hypothetical protein
MNSLALTRRVLGDLQGARQLFEQPWPPANGYSARTILGPYSR